MKKKKTLTKYKKELDALFSKYVRAKYAVNGIVKCYTCPHQGEIKKMQNGHFVPRQYLATRWDERNCRPQCYACNMLYGGQGSTFAENLINEYGQDIVSELNKARWKTVKISTMEYEERIEEMKKKLSLQE